MASKIRNIVSTGFWITGIALVASLLLSILWVVYYGQFEVHTTPQMVFYKFKPACQQQNCKVEYQWVPIDSVSRNVIIAFLAAEDPNFYVHDGFSPINEEDSVTGMPSLEKETITQKAAHSVFLTKGDSKAKKILGPYFTVLEEYLWGKERILEIYLNTALLGDGIFGVEAASHIYFGKGCGDLTTQEAALLASFLEHPENINIENIGEDVLSRQKAIILRMGLMMHIKIGKTPVDEKEITSPKPVYRRQWRG